MDEKTVEIFGARDHFHSRETECGVNLANPYKLTRGNDGYHLPSLRAGVFDKQRIGFSFQHL